VSVEVSSEQVLSPADLARRLGVHPQTIHNWRFTGKGPEYFRLGKHVFYRLEDVVSWELATGRRPA
jgi:hypothetical protein